MNEPPVTPRDPFGRSFSGVPGVPPPKFPSVGWFCYVWWSFVTGWRRGGGR